MNYRMVFKTTGQVLCTEAVMLLLPAVVSLLYLEWFSAISLAISSGAAFLIGIALVKFCKPKNHFIFAKEGLVTVALAWIAVSLVGALPFVISGEIPNYIDAFFETVSGFTTTGSSIITDLSKLSKGMLFWRSFTHWIGGMGVLVFILAITSKSTDRSMHILRAEVPGPIVDKVVPKMKDTARILYLIYLVMTAVLVVLLLCGGMSLYDSLLHAFGTAGTGGFGIKPDSVAGYSPYIQWVIAVFMMLFGINFNLYFFILVGKIGGFFKSRELWGYIGIILAATTIICLDIYSLYGNFAETLRIGFFQVSSIITTTGFATANFAEWSIISKTVLLLLMFIGACAGSTGGGFKVGRLMILVKKMANDLKKVLHPRNANVVKFEGKRLDEETLNGVSSYFAVYVLLFVLIFILLSFDTNIQGVTAFETNFSAAASCFNNIGPGLAQVGPLESFAIYSPFSKIVLSIAMLLGRLEIYPILLTLNPSVWIKR